MSYIKYVSDSCYEFMAFLSLLNMLTLLLNHYSYGKRGWLADNKDKTQHEKQREKAPKEFIFE